MTEVYEFRALLWENDPYWTYWITKTFLIATVFGLGTAWLGMGIGRGAAITAVHTVVLTAYYWSLSPIGLPSHPEWLDLEHTWVTRAAGALRGNLPRLPGLPVAVAAP